MKKILLITVAILILGLAVPVPAQGREVTGEQLYLWGVPEQDFPAGEPFFIAHGWINLPRLKPPPGLMGLLTFELEMDGQLIREDYHFFIPDPWEQPIVLYRNWVYNFPEGLTGDHIFTLHYYAPCILAYGEESCPPPYRNEVVELYTYEALVHFVPAPPP